MNPELHAADCRPKVLITVSGGVAEALYDDAAVDVHIADYDNEPDQKLPKAFARLLQSGYQERYRELFTAVPEILSAAKAVIKNWQSGDLAGAVRRLDAVIQELEKDTFPDTKR